MPGPKLTPYIRRRFCDFLEQGHTFAESCDHVDISTATYYNWMRRGAKEKRGMYASFYKAVEKAKEVREDTLLDVIYRHALLGSSKQTQRTVMNNGQWVVVERIRDASQVRTAQWLLGLNKPEVYGKAALEAKALEGSGTLESIIKFLEDNKDHANEVHP